MEDFVPNELAKKLREKGFRELCTHFYRNGNLTPVGMFCGIRSNTHHAWSFNSMKVKLKDTHEIVQFNIVNAPTIPQVLKWLRKNHNLDISTKSYPCEDGLRWECCVRKFSPVLVCELVNKTGFQEPEQSALAGINYILDNLIQND